jgi:hypothetical protein
MCGGRTRVDADAGVEADLAVVEELVEHDRVDDAADRRAGRDEAHHERAPALEVVRGDAEARDVDHAEAEAHLRMKHVSHWQRAVTEWALTPTP